MEDKIDKTIEYYKIKEQQILNAVNSSNNLTADDIMHYGKEMSIVMYKITALEIAKEN
jgi:hypothetical protein|nr:hypothetical protein [uncultured Psychroserpens sp.]